MNAEQILRLVEIGSTIGLNHDEAITKLENLGITWKELHFDGVEGWKNVAQGMTEVDLVAIVKSLVLLDTTQEYSSGSVAPAIWLFKELTNRRFTNLLTLAEWIDDVSKNEYLPFGTIKFRANSFRSLREKSG